MTDTEGDKDTVSSKSHTPTPPRRLASRSASGDDANKVRLKRMGSIMRIKKMLAKDAASKKKRIGLFHSIVMGFCLMVLLMTILVTQEPYRFIRSNLALQRGVLLTRLQEDPDLNIDTLWEWFDAVSVEVGGHTHDEVVLNCGYSAYDTQTVEVDGKNYTMLKPGKLDSACAQSSLGYIDGIDDPLYLIASHQLLATGAFTKRSNTNFPIAGSAASRESTLEVNSDKSEPLNPIKDNKVIEVCSVEISAPAGNSSSMTISPPGPAPVARRRSLQGEHVVTCVHKDGLAHAEAPYTPGATMNWEGEVITEDGEEYYAYHPDHIATIFEDETKEFTSYPPCYIIGEDDGLVYSGVREFTGTAQELRAELKDCTNTWISKGRDFRSQCLREQNTGREATAQQSYLAGFYELDDVPSMYEAFFGCESLINWDPLDIDNAFVEARRPIESFLHYDHSYGAFFATENEQAWVEGVVLGEKTLRMHGFFDKQTTEAAVYFVTRNLDEAALFYTLVKISFSFRVNGYSNVRYEAVFSPMTQYEYGMDGYGWRHRQMLVWEVMFLVLFGLFAIREVYQLVTIRIYPMVQKVYGRSPVSPLDEEEGKSVDKAVDRGKNNSGDGGGVLHAGSPNMDVNGSKQGVGNPKYNVGDEVYDFDSGSENDFAVKPPTKGINDLNKGGRSTFEKLDSFMFDLNQNGIDDAEELMEFVDDFLLPDTAGMLDILDWITIGIVSVAIYYRLDYINKTADLHEFFLELAEEQNYHDSMTEIIDSFAAIQDNLSTMNTLVMILVFFGIIQFFRYLSFDKRLGIVTATIKESLGSLLPVLLIFMVVMFAYAVLGTVMYGAHLSDWSNVGKSVAQLFLLILGEFDSYVEIMQINPLLSAVFFWSYIIMALFLLFNMVLAVIFTVYEEKNTEIMALEAAEREEELKAKELKKDK